MALTTFSGPVKSDNGFIAGAGATVTSVLAATATVDFASIPANTTADSSAITVTGAAVGDAVFVGSPAAIEAGIVITGFVSAANAVKVRAANVTAAAIDPASGAFKVVVIKTV
jgi:hypothetical protein